MKQLAIRKPDWEHRTKWDMPHAVDTDYNRKKENWKKELEDAEEDGKDIEACLSIFASSLSPELQAAVNRRNVDLIDNNSKSIEAKRYRPKTYHPKKYRTKTYRPKKYHPKRALLNALVVLADSLDSKGLTKEAEEVDAIIREAAKRECPECNNNIPINAKRCPYCGAYM